MALLCMIPSVHPLRAKQTLQRAAAGVLSAVHSKSDLWDFEVLSLGLGAVHWLAKMNEWG